MKQAFLDFDSPPRPIGPCDPKVTEAEKPRLSRQCERILARLSEGPATNDELSRISRKYTSRVSDLRKAGYQVECFDHDHASGVTHYRLQYDAERRP